MHHNNLDPLRGLAAFAVVLHHLSVYTQWALPWLSTVGGLLGVQLFFAISGYLIVQSASSHSLRVYLLRRAGRIYPAYWAAIVLVAAASVPLSQWHWPTDWVTYAIHFFAITHFSPAALQRHDVLTVSWTLTVEICWYLLAPLLVWCHRHGTRHTTLAISLGVLAGSSLWVGLAQRGLLDAWFASAIANGGVSPVNAFTRFAYIVNAAPAQLVFFMVGVMVWRYQRVLLRLSWWIPLTVLVTGAGGAQHWNEMLGLNPSFVSGLGMGALLVIALKAPLITWQWPHRLGQWAYPVYLLHVPIIITVFHRMQLYGWFALVVASTALLVMSALLHHLVESPCNRWVKSRVN